MACDCDSLLAAPNAPVEFTEMSERKSKVRVLDLDNDPGVRRFQEQLERDRAHMDKQMLGHARWQKQLERDRARLDKQFLGDRARDALEVALGHKEPAPSKVTEVLKGLTDFGNQINAQAIGMSESLREASLAEARRKGQEIARQEAMVHHLAHLVQAVERAEARAERAEERAREAERRERERAQDADTRDAKRDRRNKWLAGVTVVSAGVAVVNGGPEAISFLLGLFGLA
jgi:hypothetical protein